MGATKTDKRTATAMTQPLKGSRARAPKAAPKKATRRRKDPIPVLTDRQAAIMTLLAEGKSDEDVAAELGLGHRGSVRRHVSQALAVNDVPNRLRLAVLIERAKGAS